MTKCPLKKNLYCACCSQYGHKTLSCELYGDYGTIMEPPPVEAKSYKPVLDVVNTPHCIRAIITSYGRTPSGRPKQNILILEEIAEVIGSRLLLHTPK